MKDDLLLSQKPGTEAVLLGNHAMARGAVEAGVHLVSAYPGTPSSEISEALNDASLAQGFHSQWSTNEKVAFDVAAGAALVGRRSLVTMKTAGLSVAADTFLTVPYGGVKGGFVIIVADDPDAHFSSTEHDSRPMARQAEILCLEPADGGEAKEMVRQAFDLSERLELPVLVRSVARVSHGSANVTLGPIEKLDRRPVFNKHYGMSYRWDVYGTPGTKAKHEWLVRQFEKLEAYADESPFNELKLVADRAVGGPGSGGARLGLLAAGLGSAYAYEAVQHLGLAGQVNWLKLGTPYPLPPKKLAEFLKSCDRVLVVEEGTSFVEGLVREVAQRLGVKVEIIGKGVDTAMPLWGEVNTDMVVRALAPLAGADVAKAGAKPGAEAKAGARAKAGATDAVTTAAGEAAVADAAARAALKAELEASLCPRSSTLCAGCPHMGSYWGLRLALQKQPKDSVHILNGDIGCYEQAGYGLFAENLNSDQDHQAWKAQTVYEMLDTIYVMGSAVGMAQGQSLAGYDRGKVVAVAGDSSFFHAALPAVANLAWNGGNVVFMVLDNRWTAMTGHQPSPTTGRVGNGSESVSLDIASAAKALGIKNVYTADAYDVKSVQKVVEEAFAADGVAVIVVSGECRLQTTRRERHVVRPVTVVDPAKCNGCGICLQVGCPGLGLAEDGKKVEIDQLQCNSCGLCMQACNRKAIHTEGGAN
ncbi:MAG: thiamine pyrophosphate-dependent enzyme [Bacillota bacterium]